MVTLSDVRVGDRIRVTHTKTGSIREGVVAKFGSLGLYDSFGHLLTYALGEYQDCEILERASMAEPTEYGTVVQTDEGRAVRLNGKHYENGSMPWVLLVEHDMRWVPRNWEALKNPRPVEALP